MRGWQKAVIVFLLIFSHVYLIGAIAPAFAETPPVVEARPLTDPIHLDGKLLESAWQSAGLIPDLTQQDPEPGQPTPFRTTVYLLVDRQNLYIGVHCIDPEPDQIALHTMQRDGNLHGDQTIAIVLDTFGDRRRGYYFEINRAGARVDGLISGPEQLSLDWDGIWNVRTHRTKDGWTAEIQIPTQTLRFTPGVKTWGFNIQRRIARKRITLRWAGTTLDAKFIDLRRAGRLEGVGNMQQGLGLSVSPYGLLSRNADFVIHHTNGKGESGLDVTYNLTPELAVVATVNTDFAETEVDTRQVNLTRFPLFFPEKRAFFLEASNLFSFGIGLREEFIPFFSRRIGLFQGRPVPLIGGLKVLGRVGRWGIAALDVMADETELTRRTNLFAGRMTYDFTDHFTMGLLTTIGDPDGIHQNRLFGFDAVWQTSTFLGNKNFAVGGWAVINGGDLPEGRHTGWGFKIDYPNDLWDLFFVFKTFGDGLDPALGFITRPGTRWYVGGGAYQPRPRGGPFGWVRQFFFETFIRYIEDLHGRAESWRIFTAPFNARTESGEHLEGNVVFRFERLDEPFEITKGVIIPPGKYHFTRFRLEAQSSSHRPWRIGSTLWFGTFYSGHLTQWESFINLSTFHGHLQLEFQMENDFIHLPEGHAIQRLWQVRFVYAFTPDLILSSYIQYDTESRNLGTNTRLRWTLQPGNDIFIIWNHGWERPIGARDVFTLKPVSDQIVVKVRWTFRM